MNQKNDLIVGLELLYTNGDDSAREEKVSKHIG